MIVLEIPTNLLTIDEDLYPDQDQSLDFDHLQYYCSKFVATSPLPAIGASFDRGVLYVTDGQKYVKIARALNVLKIRAYFDAGNNAGEIQNLLSLNGVKSISQSALDDELAQTTVLQGHHVFFFQLKRNSQLFQNKIVR